MATFNNGESGSSIRTKINNVLQHLDGTSGSVVVNDAGADVDFRVESDTNANALFVDGATGNVGIGTAAPSKPLEVAGDAKFVTTSGIGLQLHNDSSNQSFIQFSNTVTGETPTSGFQVGIDSAEEGLVWHYRAEPIKFATNNTERLRITSTGNVGIGTSSPEQALDVRGAVQAKVSADVAQMGALGTGIGYFQTYGASFAAIPMAFYTGTNERMRIDASGNVGIGTSSPQMPLTVNGTLQAINSTGVSIANGATATVLTPPRGYSYVNVSTGAGTIYGLLLLVFRSTSALTIVSTVDDRTSADYSASVSGTALQVTNSYGSTQTFYASCVNIGFGTGQ